VGGEKSSSELKEYPCSLERKASSDAPGFISEGM